MNINPEEFKPKANGVSDFFSWNLYRYLKKHNNTRIYKAKEASEHNYRLFIGDSLDEGWLHGLSLRKLCSGSPRGHQERSAYSPHYFNKIEDITTQFFSEYRKVGVCAIHGDYAHKFTNLSDTERKCEYCGAIEVRKERIEYYWGKA